MALLMLPKFFSLVLYLRNRERAARVRRPAQTEPECAARDGFSAFIAPILAAERTRFVVGILLGRNVKWQAQQRDDRPTSLREALRRHAAGTVLGLAWSGLFLFAAPRLLWWFSPVLAGLVLAIPGLSLEQPRHGGRLGEAARPVADPRGNHHAPTSAAAPGGTGRLPAPVAGPPRAMAWPGCSRTQGAFEVHLALLPPAAAPADPLDQHRLEGLQLKVLVHGPDALTPQEKRELLLDPDSIRSLKLGPPTDRVAA